MMDIPEINCVRAKAEDGTVSRDEIEYLCDSLIDALCELETLRHGAEK